MADNDTPLPYNPKFLERLQKIAEAKRQAEWEQQLTPEQREKAAGWNTEIGEDERKAGILPAGEQDAAYSVEASAVLEKVVPNAKRRRGWCKKQGIRCKNKGKRLFLHNADWQRYVDSNRRPAAPSTDEATPALQTVAEMTLRLLEVKAATGRALRLSDAE